MTQESDPLKVVSDADNSWYKDGLRFKCTGCGKCCTGAPGAVWISDEEVELLSEHLNLTVPEFTKKYTRLIDGKRSLIEDPVNYDCVFLKNNQCTVYAQRPLQCRTYPWWPNNLRNKKDWENAANWCEGINHPESEVVSFSVIQKELHEHIDGGGH